MTYNVHWDSIFPADDPQNHELRAYDRYEPFRRLLRAVRPDVICLQEINPLRSPRDLSQSLAEALEPQGGEVWQAVNVRDNVIAARFPLAEEGFELQTGSILAVLDQAAALVDLPEGDFGPTDLYVICAHFASGSGPEDILVRARQADVIMAQVRDFETPGGNLDLPEGTPFVILGDFNAYDSDLALHVRTLTGGDIQDEARYGADFAPDWDGTDLQDGMPSLNGLGLEFYTWRNDSVPFPPAALDRVIFADSGLRMSGAFVLNTLLLTDEALASHGLEREDVRLDPVGGIFDHLPVVVDFHLSP